MTANEFQEKFDSQVFTMTTIIKTKYTIDTTECISQASGFFYEEVSNDGLNLNEIPKQFLKIKKYWLVTNRHVVFYNHNNEDHIVSTLTFNLREHSGDIINWFPITLNKNELIKNLRIHQDSSIDVVLIDISSYIKNIINTKGSSSIFFPKSLSNLNLPENQPLIKIEIASDVIVVSYPKGFYDDYNKFPIVKSGIIASGWGLYFNKIPCFQIDAQLFPGSSGGLVISKPTDLVTYKQQILINPNKQFVFLGIYSGEYSWTETIKTTIDTINQKRSYGLGNVWYSHLIPEIIKLDISYSAP